MSESDDIEQIARVLHEAHAPYCDYTYIWEDDRSSRHVYEDLARAILPLIASAREEGAREMRERAAEFGQSVANHAILGFDFAAKIRALPLKEG